MARQVEVVYLGHDNSLEYILKADGVAVDLAGVNKMTLTFGSVLVSSTNLDSDPIRWAKNGYATGEIRVFLGEQSTITTGEYAAPLVVYDSANEDGIVWGRIPIYVEAEIEASPPAP